LSVEAVHDNPRLVVVEDVTYRFDGALGGCMSLGGGEGGGGGAGGGGAPHADVETETHVARDVLPAAS
jgi:hypothetical protein